MSTEHRAWFEPLIQACERVADDMPGSRNPHVRAPLEDVEALRVQLVSELEAAESNC